MPCLRVRHLLLPSACLALAQLAPTVSGQQPLRPNAPLGQYEIVGNSVVSGQQVFLGTLDKVYVIDKTENNPIAINGHPSWAAEYSVSGNVGRPMDIVTNTFCAGGASLGNGTWLNVGGNQAVTYGGATAQSQNGGAPFDDPDGGQSVRLLDPCDDQNCNWRLTKSMSTRRWYPSCEPLPDGRVVIIGGCNWGGFVNDASQTNPTYEFFPPAPDAAPITSPFLQRTLPVNLYPITWMLPSGKLFMQANFDTVLLDYESNTEFRLSDMPHAVRTYPASAGTVMLPLTPQNNWTATLVFCGGSDIASNNWTTSWDIASFPASTSCVRITPDVSGDYEEDDSLVQGRSMGNMILLPTGKVVYLNGAADGVAGYGNDSWAIGESYANNAVFQAMLYDPAAPAGQRWSTGGFGQSTIARMYHSTATLLPDGALLVMGSNPNSDVNLKVKYPTEYRVERLYPSYYNTRRPEPQGIPASLSYGGSPFDITLTADDLFGDVQNLNNTSAVVMRTGFSTHTLNMGQRMVVLESSYTGNADGSATLHVSQVPPNPAILPPGPALFFVVVNGVPSVASMVMIGSGQIEVQKVQKVQPLPQSKTLSAADSKLGNNVTNISTNIGTPGPTISTPGTTGSSGYSPTGSPSTNANSQSANAAASRSPLSAASLWLGALMLGLLAGLVACNSLM